MEKVLNRELPAILPLYFELYENELFFVRSIIQKTNIIITYGIENWKITLHFLTHRICVIRDAVFRQSLCLTETIYTFSVFRWSL